MAFKYGAVRWVFLIGPYAIKVARIRPLHPFIRLYQHFRAGVVRKELAKFDSMPARAGLKYLLGGILANLAEYRLYRRFGNQRLIPTLFTFFGLVNIQVRGEPVPKERLWEMQVHPMWCMTHGIVSMDIRKPEQFCLLNGVVCLADYGRYDLEPFLATVARTAAAPV